jgi:quinol monooxygenase YgiN
MMHAGFNLFTGDPLRLDDSIKYIESALRPLVESQPGSLGISLHANPELGLAVLETFWRNGDYLRDSEYVIGDSCSEAARRAAGTVTVEHYAVPVFERDRPMIPGAGVRLTRMDVAPSSVDDAIEVFGDTETPWLAEEAGCSSVLYLVDRASGRSISETVWRDAAALAGSRSAAAAERVRAAETAGCVIRALQECTLVVSSARK